MKRRVVTVSLIMSLLFSITACGNKDGMQAENLMRDIKPCQVNVEASMNEQQAQAIRNFSVELFKESMEEGENVLISPIAVLSALGMTSNGAEGETLAQMEAVFGMPVEEVNSCLQGYARQGNSQEDVKLCVANSIWFKEDKNFSVNREFLQKGADYYGAGIYQTVFDQATLEDMNGWVSENTDGMIKEFLEQIPEEALMYLISALTFDAQWEDIYTNYQVREGIFTREDGAQLSVDFMYSEEGRYLEDENARGFMKSYLNWNYVFVVLLPDEGTHVADYVASLDGERVNAIIENRRGGVIVEAALPKFEVEYDSQMQEVLIGMGITDAFDDAKADFSGIGGYENANLAIDDVLHKTYITVNEKGTMAGAAAAVTVYETSEEPADIEIQEVYLDRPFVYMIIDGNTNVPIFMGTVMEIEQ